MTPPLKPIWHWTSNTSKTGACDWTWRFSSEACRSFSEAAANEPLGKRNNLLLGGGPGSLPPTKSCWAGWVKYALLSFVVLPSVCALEGKKARGRVINEAFNQCIPVVAIKAVGAVAGGLLQVWRTAWRASERDSNELAGALKKIW
jgi:hypothetical protein